MTARNSVFHSVLAMSALLVTSCTDSKSRLSNLRDAQVSEITLAEPLVAEAKLVDQVRRLRGDPSKSQELAGALAELSMVHREFGSFQDSDELAKQAALLLDPADRRSHAYFLTRRALCFTLNGQGLHGYRILEPLLDVPLSDLDKSQIYNDLADMTHFLNRAHSARDYAVRALSLRSKVAGPHSLEVAESLITVSAFVGDAQAPLLDKELCSQIQLPVAAVSPGRDPHDISNHMSMCRRRAAQIREDILGSSSQQLAEALVGAGEDEPLRAAAIYENLFGADSERVASTYALLAGLSKDRLKAQEYNRKASVISALRQAQNDPLKRAYVFWKSMLPKEAQQDRQDLLTKTFQTLGSSPPEMQEPEMEYDAIGWVLDVDRLAIPEFERLMTYCSTSLDSDLGRDRLFIEGWKEGSPRSAFRMNLPTWGGDQYVSPSAPLVEVIGKGRIRFRQRGSKAQGYQEVEYKWNGRSFEEIGGRPGDQDAEVVRAAIDDAVNGLASYGIRGHHAVDHDLIEGALSRANERAQELSKNYGAAVAADRLWIMFELTSDLVDEASTGVPVESSVDDSKDDVQKWIRAWTCNTSQCSVNLADREWAPLLKNYAAFRQQAGQSPRARKVLEAIRDSTVSR